MFLFLGVYMKHTYKTRIYRVLVNAAMGLALALIVGFIAGFFIPSNIVRALVFIAVLAGYVWLVIITIEVDDKTLTIKKGKKTDVYDIATTAIRAKIVTSTYGRSSVGSDTECSLYLTRQGEDEVLVDCELIGISHFNELLENLGITGDSVAKLDTENTTEKHNS